MNMNLKSLSIVIVFLFISLTMTALDNGGDTIRWGIFIGANDGGRDQVKLLYADDDAAGLAETLTDIGGLSPRNAEILIDPDPQDVLDTLDKLAEIFRQQEPGVKKELIFYYSGHSDDEGMQLGNDKLSYSDVKKGLNLLNADVTVAVLDSCSSGAFTRAKGGVHRAPFMLDDSVHTEGHAYLTSSSASEISQESDLIGGSFFTYFLIAGLRGAADSNGDSRVTLNELYQHTYSETINRTLETGGVQHPTYEINLSGSGDLVMTDLQQPSSVLILDRTLEGQLFIKNGENQLVLEMSKPLGQDFPLALPAGEYTVQVVHSTGLSKSAPILLEDNQSLRLTPFDLSPVGMETARKRGNEPLKEEEEDENLIRIDSEDGEIIITRDGIQIVDKKDNSSVAVDVDLEKLIENNAERAIEEFITQEINDSLGGSDREDSLYVRNQQNRKEYSEVGFALTVFPGMGTHNLGDKLVHFEIGVICQAAAVDGAQLGYIGARTLDYSNAIQAAGIYTIADKSLSGIQSSGIYASVNGEFEGIQAAGIYGQVNGPVSGIQANGLVSTARGDVQGIQVSGLVNTAGALDGIQVAGLVNIARGNVNGIQSAGLVNRIEGNLDGIQSSGLINTVTGDADGIQIGIINVANSLSGVPVGIINLYREGITTIGGWQDIEGGDRSYYSIMTGNNWFYTHFFMGADRFDLWNDARDYSIGTGLGVRLPLFWGFSVDADINHHLYLSADNFNTLTADEEEWEKSFDDIWGDQYTLLGRAVITTDWDIQPYWGYTAELKKVELLSNDPFAYVADKESKYGFACRMIFGIRMDFF